MKLIDIGSGSLVNADRVVSVLNPDSSPIKRVIQSAKENGRLIDASQGRRTASVILTDSDHVILSYLDPSQISADGEKIPDNEKKQTGRLK